METTIRIGGEAGQGLQTVGATLARVLSRMGFHVFTHQDYMSRIRGGHNFYQLRVSTEALQCSRRVVDILVALDAETVRRHQDDLAGDGVVLYDAESVKEQFRGPAFVDVPFAGLAATHGGASIMAGSVAVGAVLGRLGLDLSSYGRVAQAAFSKKGTEAVAGNVAAAEAGRAHLQAHRPPADGGFRAAAGDPLALINGSQAIGFGALTAGCRFYAAYPMTPATGIMNYLAAKARDFGLVVEQAEDEIAAINMAIGASFGGVRAMTGSSGGGFALMVEGLSLAGMTETPLVIAEVQRPGPATGLPTRTEQGDLAFVLSSGHGEFPRVVFAPGDPVEALTLTNRAFDLAERFQVPVFVLSDQYLADAEWTLAGVDRGNLVYRDVRLGKSVDTPYRRHAFTDDGVSPLAVPGRSAAPVVTDSDEHDEAGHIIEDAPTRRAMVEKRLKKLSGLRGEIHPPAYTGVPDAAVVLLGWGSTRGVIAEVVATLAGRGRSVGAYHFSELWPFPSDEALPYRGHLRAARQTLVVENNATGQFERLLRAETGQVCTGAIRKYDGRPFMLEELLELIDERLDDL